ncbi:DUF1054 domain-containing protein [Alicyclobacillus acidiphilus]|uniref:DUF1054 domain-containing protein n=1 Tax=Alicyclobacillus acidiphilus TaxID=182455 RepID=UPI000829D4BC|nr:DUF1054 domain-containing protein [Alicyclobacillus acidiphilus]
MSVFSGFDEADFEVFSIPGLDSRMNALKARTRPKLEELGRHFSAFLSPRVQEQMYAHVAKHARRTVNPPDDTWVAFSANARGYKQHPHFQIGLWSTHVFITFGYIYEATGKAAYGAYLERLAEDIVKWMPDDFVYIPDHTSRECVPSSEVSAGELRTFGQRLQTYKGAELLVGRRIERDDAVRMSGQALIDTAEQTFEALIPLYREATVSGQVR